MKSYPPPGALVDVGGHRLHLYATGAGEPAVVFDAALGASCLSWSLVQPEIARHTRAVSYDRAGLGWSDASPSPRTAGRCAEELDALLDRAGIGDRIFVGHSFGALVVQLCAARNPSRTRGLVLLDPPVIAEWADPSPEKRKRLETGARLARRGVVLARLGIARAIAGLAGAGATALARIGTAFLTEDALMREHGRILAPALRLPKELRPILPYFWTRPRFYESLASHIEWMPESARQVRAAVSTFGDLPLTVLSATNHDHAAALARLSSQGRHVIVTGSTHWIQLDRPDAVIAAIDL
ncbi:MAG: alpha/beta hydrolase [Bryobacteraceae bacterium]